MTTCESNTSEKRKAEILTVGAILAGLLPTGTARSSLALPPPRAVLSSHPIGENDRTPPDRLLCPSLLTETAVLTILCSQESLRLGTILVINGVAPFWMFCRNTTTLLQKGAPFYNAWTGAPVFSTLSSNLIQLS